MCHSVCLVLENVPCALEKNVYYGFFGCNVLKISVKSTCFIVSFRISVTLLIFFLEDLSIDMSRVLKFLTIIIVFLSIFPYTCCFVYLGALILGTYRLMSIMFSSCIMFSFYHYVVSFCIFLQQFCFKVYFVWYEYCKPLFLSFPFAWNIFFYTFPFNLCVSFALKWVNTLYSMLKTLVFLSSLLLSVFWFKHLIHWHLR